MAVENRHIKKFKFFVPRISYPKTLRDYIQSVLENGGPSDPSVDYKVPALHTAVPTLYAIKDADPSESYVSEVIDSLMKPIKDGIVIARRHDFT
jgi:hypothetical protein